LLFGNLAEEEQCGANILGVGADMESQKWDNCPPSA